MTHSRPVSPVRRRKIVVNRWCNAKFFNTSLVHCKQKFRAVASTVNSADPDRVVPVIHSLETQRLLKVRNQQLSCRFCGPPGT